MRGLNAMYSDKDIYGSALAQIGGALTMVSICFGLALLIG